MRAGFPGNSFLFIFVACNFLFMLRRFWFACCVLLVVGCGSPSTGERNRFQVAVLKGPSAMSMVRLINEGFTCHGKKAEFRIYNEPDQVKALMVRRQAEIVLLPANLAAILYNKGVSDYALVAVPVWGSLYLAGTDTTVHSLEDLRQKTIYLMARGATPDIVFRFLLKTYNIDPEKDVMLDYTFNGHFELASAITAGRAPLGVISEPFVSLSASKNNNVKPLISLEEIWNQVHDDSVPMVQTAVMVRRDFLEKNKEIVNEFFMQYKEGVAWIQNNCRRAGLLVAGLEIVPDENVACDALKRCHIRFAFAWDEREKLDRYWKILFTFNPDAVGGKLPDLQFYAEVTK